MRSWWRETSSVKASGLLFWQRRTSSRSGRSRRAIAFEAGPGEGVISLRRETSPIPVYHQIPLDVLADLGLRTYLTSLTHRKPTSGWPRVGSSGYALAHRIARA